MSENNNNTMSSMLDSLEILAESPDDGKIVLAFGDLPQQLDTWLDDAESTLSEVDTTLGDLTELREDMARAVEAAGDAKDDAETQAANAEAWAVGTRGGTDVSTEDETYHNNSKYYAEQTSTGVAAAAASASAAATSAGAAAGSASDAASSANESAVSAAAASASATAASSSQTSAASSATAAAASQTAAAASETSASNSAASASSSATSASGSATAAAASASAAAQSAQDAEDVLDSIPPDYTTTVQEVSALKSALNGLDSEHTPATIEIVHNIEYPNYYDQTEGFGGYVSGNLDGAGALYENDNFRTTKDFIPIDTSKYYRLQALGVGGISPQTICFYGANKAFISYVDNTSLQSVTFPSGTKYIKYVITKNQYNTYIATGLVFASVPTSSSVITRADVVSKIPLNDISIPYLENDVVYGKGSLSVSGGSKVKITYGTDSDYSAYITFYNKLVANFGGKSGREVLEWSDISSDISTYITVSGNSATITVGTYRWLVFNVTDYKLHIRTYTSLQPDDFIILYNDARNAQGWAINYETYKTRVTSDEILSGAGTGKYNTMSDSYINKCESFSSLMLDVAEYESFLFFTDPHWLGTLWSDDAGKNTVYNLFAMLQRYVNATNITFTLCGGDWLDNSDTEAQASFKLGFVKGSMKNLAPYYMLVGNHDTNYQGDDTLSAQSISNLWYDGKKSYFDFNGLNTHFYCFDTGVENENIDYEQVAWFADALLSDSSDHIALAMHILYYTLNPSPTIQPLAQTILDIAQAYNNRTSITVNGHTYNYASASGKVEFVIAGHTHVDANYTVNGIPCIVTRNTWISGSVTYAFDLVCVNYDDRQIDLIRVGNGSDRKISF